MSDGPDRIVEKARYVEVIDDVGRGIAAGDVCDGHDIDRKQDHKGGVELPGTPKHPGCADGHAAFQHDLGVSGRGHVARDEDEHVHRAAETVVSKRDPARDIVWNVVQKEEPVRHSEKQIEPRIARSLREKFGIHRSLFEF